MKTFIRVLGASLMTGLLLLASLGATAGAHSLPPKPSYRLLLSPVSGGLLMAQAIHSGKIQLPRYGAGHSANVPNLTVLPNVQASGGGQPVNENPIATNPANISQLLSGGNDYNCANLRGFYTSSNGGTTWSQHCSASTLSSGCGDPAVGYDLHGTIFAAGIDSSDNCSSSSEIGVETSTNNGSTWNAPVTAVTSLLGGFVDKDWLQVDNSASSPHANSVYISTTQFATNNNSEIAVTHSNDGGATWHTVAVDTQQVYPAIDQFSDVAIAKDGTVYASWMRCTANGPTGDCGGTVAKMVVSKSTNGGSTWSAPVTIASVHLAPDTCGAFYGCLPNTPERVSNIPAMDVDRSTGANAGHLYVVFDNYISGHLRVQVATSTNGGTTWSKAKAVAPKTAKNDEFFPWLSVSSSGKVGVTWLDRRKDPSNISYKTFGTTSTNGSTFTTNVQVATVASNPFNDGFGGGFMGDYTGNMWSFDGKTLHASWMDSRGGSVMQDVVGGFKP